jgi:hypothetical protein
MNCFYEHHRDGIRFHYRCFDPILLDGLIQPFQEPERVIGFFDTYRQLYPVSRDTLRGIADHFQQWLKAWSAKRNIPVRIHLIGVWLTFGEVRCWVTAGIASFGGLVGTEVRSYLDGAARDRDAAKSIALEPPSPKVSQTPSHGVFPVKLILCAGRRRVAREAGRSAAEQGAKRP